MRMAAAGFKFNNFLPRSRRRLGNNDDVRFIFPVFDSSIFVSILRCKSPIPIISRWEAEILKSSNGGSWLK